MGGYTYEKAFVALVLVLAICLSMAGTALAEPKVEIEIVPYGLVLFSRDITRVSGSTYKVWAMAQPAVPEYVIVGFDLYRVVSGSEVYITSGSASGTGTAIQAAQTLTLSSGTYKLYAWYYGQTQSDSVVMTKTI